MQITMHVVIKWKYRRLQRKQFVNYGCCLVNVGELRDKTSYCDDMKSWQEAQLPHCCDFDPLQRVLNTQSITCTNHLLLFVENNCYLQTYWSFVLPLWRNNASPELATPGALIFLLGGQLPFSSMPNVAIAQTVLMTEQLLFNLG